MSDEKLIGAAVSSAPQPIGQVLVVVFSNGGVGVQSDMPRDAILAALDSARVGAAQETLRDLVHQMRVIPASSIPKT